MIKKKKNTNKALEPITARTLSGQRRAALVEDFVDGSIRTPDVQALLKLRTPQAAHRLRSRGRLIGSAVGNQTWFPAWQFDGGRLCWRVDATVAVECV